MKNIILFCIALLFCGCPKDETVAPEPDAITTAPIIDVVQDKSKWLAISDFRVKYQLRNEGSIQYNVTPYLVTNVGYENGVFKQIGMVNTTKVNFVTSQRFQDDTAYHELTFSKNGSSRSSKIISFPRCNFAKYRTNTHILDYYKPNTIVGVYTAAYQPVGFNEFFPNIVGDETYLTGGNIPGGIGAQIFINMKHRNEGDTLYRLQDPQGVQLTMPFTMADKQMYCLIKKYTTLMIRMRTPAFNGGYNLEAGSNDRYFQDANLDINLFPKHVHKVTADGKKCFFWINSHSSGKTWGFEFDQITQVMTLKTKLQLQLSEFVDSGVMDENGDYYYVSPVQGSTFNTVRKITMGLANGSGSIAYGTNVVIPDALLKVIGKADGKLVLQANIANSQTLQHSIIIEK